MAGADPLTTHLRFVGLVMAALVVVNLLVPRRYHWRREMARLSLLNRQVFHAHAIFLVLTLALLAALLLSAPELLVERSRLARALLAGLTVFWGLRMLMQWFFYKPEIWRGHRFNTAMHVVFSLVWIYVTAVFAVALWRQA